MPSTELKSVVEAAIQDSFELWWSQEGEDMFKHNDPWDCARIAWHNSAYKSIETFSPVIKNLIETSTSPKK
jgi:hypothetical protein